MQVIVPILRNFKHMTMCHELGRAIFDITKESIRDYLYPVDVPDKELPKDAKKQIKNKYAAVQKEAQVAWERMCPLCYAYVALLVQHSPEASQQASKSKKRQSSSEQGGSGSKKS